ncbi:MAG: hypothetical protein KAU20_03370 [Nanoarchaeota archaeon]|nr:hypothetical protein [Nanoarchaeota archaeon]
MMSYLLINTENSLKRDVEKKLSEYDGVIDKIDDRGYGVGVRVITDNKNKLKMFISEQLRNIRGIKNIKTLFSRS